MGAPGSVIMSSEFSVEPVELYTAATPPPCHRAMKPQSLEPGKPATILGELVTLLLALPRALVLAPALIRRRV